MRHAIQKHPLGFEYPNLLDDPLGDGEGIGFLLELGRTVALHFAQKFGVRTQVQERDVVQTQSDRGSIHADLLLWLSNGDIQGYLAAERARGKKVQPHMISSSSGMPVDMRFERSCPTVAALSELVPSSSEVATVFCVPVSSVSIKPPPAQRLFLSIL